VGRPSLAMKRTEQIIEALAACIRDQGYEATTLEHVARKAGVQRTLIRHYFGNREDLLTAAVERLTESYRQDYLTLAQTLPAGRRLEALLSYLFGGDFNRRPDEDAVVDALVAVASRSSVARASLRRMYQTFEDTVCSVILAARPKSSRREARRVAYAIMCLAEQNATLRGLGYGARRTRDARAVAEALILALLPLRARDHKE